MDQQDAAFTYVDLFAGIGGFAAALDAMGGRCVKAVEIDPRAAAVYKLNHGIDPFGDITEIANDDVVDIPDHDVLTAGFPCQPFSKSGAQRGMDETRGTLFWNILRILEAKRPKIVLLENVRNLAGPRHEHEWEVIIDSLRQLDYRVSTEAAIFSPHWLKATDGGTPQVRERVFITATYIGDVDPGERTEKDLEADVLTIDKRREPWDLRQELPLESEVGASYELTAEESRWIEAWEKFREIVTGRMRQAARTSVQADEVRLPGFPIWVAAWPRNGVLAIAEGTPKWKRTFIEKNAALYFAHREELDPWLRRYGVLDFPASRQKFEWQAQTEPSLYTCAMQFRPSGIRAKRLTHLPALVAIAQTPVLGLKAAGMDSPRYERRLTVAEAARLQGLPGDFNFGSQPRSASYKQLGNGVHVGVVQYVLTQHLARDLPWLAGAEWAGLRALVSHTYKPWRQHDRVSRS